MSARPRMAGTAMVMAMRSPHPVCGMRPCGAAMARARPPVKASTAILGADGVLKEVGFADIRVIARRDDLRCRVARPRLGINEAVGRIVTTVLAGAQIGHGDGSPVLIRRGVDHRDAATDGAAVPV